MPDFGEGLTFGDELIKDGVGHVIFVDRGGDSAQVTVKVDFHAIVLLLAAVHSSALWGYHDAVESC